MPRTLSPLFAYATIITVVIAGQPLAPALAQPPTPTGLVAEASDSRIDLVWDRTSMSDEDTFNVYRAESETGPWVKLNQLPHTVHVYSDFVGDNGRTCFYRVTRTSLAMPFEEARNNHIKKREMPGEITGESEPSATVSATTVAMDDEQLLDSVQKAFFRYFWDFGHPVSGLARMAYLHHPRQTTTIGGSGFGMLTIVVGAERGFVTREAAAERLLKTTRFLEDVAPRYHGAWAHRMRGDTGETIAFASAKDNGGDLVETAFMIQCMIAVREYFDRDNPVENELRERITRLWEQVEWDWYFDKDDGRLFWHWSPDYAFEMNHHIMGWNECQIVYLLAIASPTHPIEPQCYYTGWARDPERYLNGHEHYGIHLPLGRDTDLGGALFWTQYSYVAMDPRALTDAYTNYFDHNRAQSLINRAYCIANPKGFKGYSALVWGITSSQSPPGYVAHRPSAERDNGTITPTAAISAFPYTPEESMATLKHFYHELGRDIWGPFGFFDAFNMTESWIANDFLAIDQGPMTPMIENQRTGLPWRLFMLSDVAGRIQSALEQAKPYAK